MDENSWRNLVFRYEGKKDIIREPFVKKAKNSSFSLQLRQKFIVKEFELPYDIYVQKYGKTSSFLNLNEFLKNMQCSEIGVPPQKRT
jgi:hypothetical protein